MGRPVGENVPIVAYAPVRIPRMGEAVLTGFHEQFGSLVFRAKVKNRRKPESHPSPAAGEGETVFEVFEGSRALQ